VHVETAARLARIAKQQGALQFVHMSARGAEIGGTSKYAQSKARGEEAVHTFFPGAVIIRPSVVFGPEDRFFNLFATLAKFLPALPLIGGGGTKLQPVYVGDVAEAMLLCLRRKEAEGQIFELGGPEVYSLRAIMELMLRITGRKRWLFDLPWGQAKFHAALYEMLPLPRPLLTRDQVELLKRDNVLQGAGAKVFRDLGVSPTAAEIILPTYLGRFHKG
ncbi:MAG: complex I NDUFA9 subunit family protein, partial [Pseudomonadota bacterium]|nr:complex I NDUFA9 subunit family protein [Pseudomonadota bacterium]